MQIEIREKDHSTFFSGLHPCCAADEDGPHRPDCAKGQMLRVYKEWYVIQAAQAFSEAIAKRM